jgi:hypothetical protein
VSLKYEMKFHCCITLLQRYSDHFSSSKLFYTYIYIFPLFHKLNYVYQKPVYPSSIALGYRLYDRGVRVPVEARNFSLHHRLQNGSGAHPASIQWVPGALSLGVKPPGREADHSPPSSAEVKECVELYLDSPNTPSWRGVQLKKAQGQLYLYFLYTHTHLQNTGSSLQFHILYYTQHIPMCTITVTILNEQVTLSLIRYVDTATVMPYYELESIRNELSLSLSCFTPLLPNPRRRKLCDPLHSVVHGPDCRSGQSGSFETRL